MTEGYGSGVEIIRPGTIGDVTLNGADPTGKRPADDAIAKTIARITTSVGGKPTFKTPLVFPAGGNFKITRDINVSSYLRPMISGYGATIIPSGNAFTKAALYINGSLWGQFTGINMVGDGTEQLPSAIQLDSLAQSTGGQVTSGNEFRDVNVYGTKYVTGFNMAGTGTNQLDGTQFDNVIFSGQQVAGAWSNAGNWVNGILAGNGTIANNYNHNGRGLQAVSHYYNYDIAGSSLSIDGAQPGNAFCDFNITPAAQCSFRNIQTQNSGRLLITAGADNAPIAFDEVLFSTLNSAFYIANLGGVGLVSLRNVNAVSVQSGGSFINPLLTAASGSANFPVRLNLDNYAVNNTKVAHLSFTAGQVLCNVRNFTNTAPTTGVQTVAAGDVISAYNGTWTNLV